MSDLHAFIGDLGSIQKKHGVLVTNLEVTDGLQGFKMKVGYDKRRAFEEAKEKEFEKQASKKRKSVSYEDLK